MDTAEFVKKLKFLGACDEAREWVATQPDAATAWEACPRADWLVWLLGALHVRGYILRQTLVFAACACADTALPHLPAGEDRPRLAIEAARRWARGEATVEEVRAFAAAAAPALAALAAYRAVAAPALAAYRAVADADAAAAAAAAAGGAVYVAYAATVCDAIRYAVPWEVVEAALTQMETT
jgi:hypothetical protein